MAIAMATFTVNDALTKAVAAHMNMGQVMLLRGFFATLLVGVIAWHQGAFQAYAQIRHPMVLLRVGAEAFATLTFLVALSHLPLANVSAVLQAAPLAVTLAAALFLAEPVGWRRWSAIVVGFGGVLIIVRPGFEGFSIYSVVALICVLFSTTRDLATRQVPKTFPTLLLTFLTSGIVTLFGATLVVPFGGWTSPSLGAYALLVSAAVMLVIGYQFMIMCMRTGDLSFVAPFRYTSLLWSILLGYMVFGDLPDLLMIVGACVIVLSGLYSLYRERRRSIQKPAAESMGGQPH